MTCGAAQSARCPSCGSTSVAGAKFCLECGAQLEGPERVAVSERPLTLARPSRSRGAVSAERRHLTVMFCDLVGSTALSARLDPEDAREIIRAYHRRCAAVIAKAGGLVAQYMGDGVLAYFGYPPAHEDDAERAVRTGLALVEAVPKIDTGHGVTLQARIGIATGIVVVGDLVRIEDTEEPDVIGEAPNLAARLQSLAEPNQVIIAASTRRLTGGLFEYRDLGLVAVKGLLELIQAWQVIGPSSVRSRFEAHHGISPAPLIGREEELELLVRRWRDAVGGEGRVVLLSGEPGIGKSRLLAALQERLRLEPHTRLRYFCSPQHTDSALFPVISQLRQAARLAPDDTPEQKLAKFAYLLAPSIRSGEFHGADDRPEKTLSRLEALLASSTAHTGESIGLLADLLSLPTGDRYRLSELSPQRRKAKTLEVLVAELGVLAKRQAVLLLFEDVHWIDPTSLELLTLALERVRQWRVLAVITSRSEFGASWPGQAHLTRLILRRLNQREATALVEQVTGGKALPNEVLQQILARTDGVPLFLEELTKSVLEGGVLREENGHYSLTGPLSPHAVPATLHSSLGARLDRIVHETQLAQMCAAIGREFSYELLRAVAHPLPEERLREALDQLVSSELVLCRGNPPHAVYTFKHVLVQDVAYDTLVRDQRRKLHARIATVLEEGFPEIVEEQPALLAHHCTQAGSIEKAIAYWVSAGQQSFGRSSTIEAIAQLQKGLDLLQRIPEGPARWRQELVLQWSLCAALMVAKGQAGLETGQAFARCRELGEQLGDIASLIQVLSGQCAYHVGRAELASAREIAEQLLRLGQAHNDTVALRVGNMHMGTCLYSLGEFVSAREHLERVLALSVPGERSDAGASRRMRPSFGGAWDSQVASHSCLSLLLFALGYPDQALSRREEALERSKKLGHPHILAYGLLMAASHDWLRGKGNASFELDHLIALCNEQRFLHWLAVGKMLRAHALAARGATAEGLVLARKAFADYSAMGFAWGQTTLLVVLAYCCERAGQGERALEMLNEALVVSDRTGERYFEAELHRLTGEWIAAHRRDAHDEAEAAFRRAIAVAHRQQAKMWELRAATSLVRLWHKQAKSTNGRNLLAPVYSWFTEGLDTPDLKEAKSLLDSMR